MTAKIFEIILIIRILLNALGFRSAVDLNQPWGEGRVFSQFIGVMSLFWCIVVVIWMAVRKKWHLKYVVVTLIITAVLSIPLALSGPDGIFFCLGFK